MKTAVVTAVHGRTGHLRNQMSGLDRSVLGVGRHVVVAIDDDAAATVAQPDDRRTHVIPFGSTSSRLPMAAARNLGARVATDEGAELLIFLDVDCIPAPDLVGRYVRAARHPAHEGALLCGPVTYLPPPDVAGYDLARLEAMTDPHPARPTPDGDDIVASTDYELFWSLSFAVTAEVWRRIGGFCTAYAGYGGEDTDFAQKAAAESISMRWVGGAHAYHQFHPVSDPPTEHLHDIVANAIVFEGRWGWWPMRGWLDAFEARGLITRDGHGMPRVLAVR